MPSPPTTAPLRALLSRPEFVEFGSTLFRMSQNSDVGNVVITFTAGLCSVTCARGSVSVIAQSEIAATVVLKAAEFRKVIMLLKKNKAARPWVHVELYPGSGQAHFESTKTKALITVL